MYCEGISSYFIGWKIKVIVICDINFYYDKSLCVYVEKKDIKLGIVIWIDCGWDVKGGNRRKVKNIGKMKWNEKCMKWNLLLLVF